MQNRTKAAQNTQQKEGNLFQDDGAHSVPAALEKAEAALWEYLLSVIAGAPKGPLCAANLGGMGQAGLGPEAGEDVLREEHKGLCLFCVATGSHVRLV